MSRGLSAYSPSRRIFHHTATQCSQSARSVAPQHTICNEEDLCPSKQQSIIPRQQSITTTRQSIIATRPSITRQGITKQPRITLTRHKDIFTTQHTTPQKPPSRTSSTTVTKQKPLANRSPSAKSPAIGR